MNFILIPFSLLLDRLLGEPRRFHPLVGFGWLAGRIEHHLNTRTFLLGLNAWILAVLPITLLVYFLDQWVGGLWLGIIFGYLAIGWQSLRQHALDVLHAFQQNDLSKARQKTAYIVSRDTSELDETALSRATIESVLENGSDAVFAPLFWLLLFGAPGVVFYRLCNTLDAMWGYHNPRYEQFGKFSARMDDALNYIPARISALLYTLCGNHRMAWKSWQQQGRQWYSPNAGVVMAAGAGALSLKLGGSAVYHGKQKQRPDLGFGSQATAEDIQRAVKLLDQSVYWFALISSILFLMQFWTAQMRITLTLIQPT